MIPFNVTDHKILREIRENILERKAESSEYALLCVSDWLRPDKATNIVCTTDLCIEGVYHQQVIDCRVRVFFKETGDGSYYPESIALVCGTPTVIRELPFENYFTESYEFEFLCLWAKDICEENQWRT